MATTTSLNDVLKREGNNFDLFRLIAAMTVIIGHAYALHLQPPLVRCQCFLIGVIAVSIFAPSHLPAPFDRVTDSHLLPA